MPITIFDGIVIGVVLFSAVLAMVRGFSREILSIASWGGSAAAAYYLYPYLVPYAKKYTDDDRIGALDRTLGFLFGAARGILLLVVAVAFWNWLVDADHRPAWVNNAKSKPFLDSLVVRLQAVLPEEFSQMIQKSITEKLGGARTTDENAPANDQAPAEDAAPAPNNGAQQPSN